MTSTMKVSIEHRDELRRIANRTGGSLDDALGQLLRLQRQHQMGLDLAERGRTDDDTAIAHGSAGAVAREIR